MSKDTAHPTERDAELTLGELDAVIGGAVVDYFHSQVEPPNPCSWIFHLNPQPLPPG
jgi:hypothetical protein